MSTPPLTATPDIYQQLDSCFGGFRGRSLMVSLREPGDYLIVPRGRWHTARYPRAAIALFSTPGEGTRHR